MGHPQIENDTPFQFEALFLQDEEVRPLFTPLVKATYAISAGGTLSLAEEQIPANLTGTHHGEPGESSFKFEPETAFAKPRTDVVLIGHARSPNGQATELEVSLQVGPLRKVVRVFGDRHFEKGIFGSRISDPEPFDRMPLVWERAFGGWDTTHEKPEKHGWEPRNPIGVGFHARNSKLVEGAPLPNLEDPTSPLKKFRGKSVPAGFGFLCPNWEPRASLAGTYDEAWTRDRSPLLPTDFQREHFNAAPADLIAPGYLEGNETVIVSNTTAEGVLRFALPSLASPQCLVTRRDADDEVLTCNLDTVIVDTDEMRLILLWRTHTTLRDGPLDVRSARLTCANAPPIQLPEKTEAAGSNIVPLHPAAPMAPAQGA